MRVLGCFCFLVLGMVFWVFFFLDGSGGHSHCQVNVHSTAFIARDQFIVKVAIMIVVAPGRFLFAPTIRRDPDTSQTNEKDAGKDSQRDDGGRIAIGVNTAATRLQNLPLSSVNVTNASTAGSVGG